MTSNGESSRRSGNRDEEHMRNFFKRISSIKLDYEKERKEIVQRYSSVSSIDETVTFLRDKHEVINLLKDSLSDDNLEQLFEELYVVLFPTARDRERHDSKSLLDFLKKLFFLDNATQKAWINKARACKVGDRVLNVEVVEARNLPAMDINGLCDPFCTLYVTSKENSKRTKVIQGTLSPQWNETFKFKLKEHEKDFITIEVWDHDPAEGIRTKVGRWREIHSAAGIGNFVKDLAHGRSSTQEFIGKISIPMKEVSSEIRERWWPLGDSHENGEIYLKVGLGIECDKASAQNMFRAILQMLIIFELTKPPIMTPFMWEHIREAWGDYLFRQLQTGWGLSPKDVLLAKWLAITNIHRVFPLSGRILPPLVHEVFEAAGNHEFNANEVSLILRASGNILDFAVSFIRKIHEFFACVATTSQLYYILKTLEILAKSAEKVRYSCDNRTPTRTEISPLSVKTSIQDAIIDAAKSKMTLFIRNLESAEDHETDEIGEAKRFLHLGQLVNDDLEKGLSMVDKDFKLISKVNYHVVTYEVYDVKLSSIMEPFVEKYCGYLRVLCRRMSVDNDVKTDTKQTESSSMFLQLYLCLKKFSELHPSACPKEGLVKSSFYRWFAPGITSLVDLMTNVWMGWMRRAIETDYDSQDPSAIDLTPYPNTANVCVTGSAVDSVQIFTQIQTFWTTLNWPDPEESIVFAQKLLKELCGFSIFFANRTCECLKSCEESFGTSKIHYVITPRVCRAVNNIHYVGEYTKEIAMQLNLEQLLLEIKSESRDITFMDKQIEIYETGIKCVIDDIFKTATDMMDASLHHHIQEILKASDEKNQMKEDEKIVDFISYLTSNLQTSDEHLLPFYFGALLGNLWEGILAILKQHIAIRTKELRQYQHFLPIKKILEIVKGYFETTVLRHSAYGRGLSNVTSTLNHSPLYNDIIKDLDLLASSGSSIKLAYLDHRCKKQTTGDRGFLCVRLSYQKENENLKVEILNARKLPAADTNGKSDPFVEIQLLPEENFAGIPSYSTKVIRETLTPIFDETFNIKLPDSLTIQGGHLRLQVYDHDYLKRNEFLGEALVPLSSLGGKNEMKMQLLPLTAPEFQDIEFLKSLMKNRSDKELKRFLDAESEKLKPPQV